MLGAIFLLGLFLFFPIVFLISKKLRITLKFSAWSIFIATALLIYLIVAGFGILMWLAWGVVSYEIFFSLSPFILISAIYLLFKRKFPNFQPWKILLFSLVAYYLVGLVLSNISPFFSNIYFSGISYFAYIISTFFSRMIGEMVL